MFSITIYIFRGKTGNVILIFYLKTICYHKRLNIFSKI